jgi:hypothetical protein
MPYPDVSLQGVLISLFLCRTSIADTTQIPIRSFGRACTGPSEARLNPAPTGCTGRSAQAIQGRCQTLGGRTQKNRFVPSRRKILGSWRQFGAYRSSHLGRFAGRVFRDLSGYPSERWSGECGFAVTTYLGAPH